MSAPGRIILVYGSGGIGKSTLVADANVYLGRARIVGADGGGTTSAIQHIMDAGRAEYWPIDQWDEASTFDLLDRATKGWWPVDPTTPNSPLLPGVQQTRPCSACGGDSGAKGLAMVPKCASCGVAYPTGTVLPLQTKRINGLENIDLLAFEGLTSFGDILLRRLRKVDATGGRHIQDGGYTISAPGQQHYWDAQAYLAQYVANCRQIPVKCVVWTALESRGEDEGKPLYGPKGPGKALTSACIPWFTDVLHLDAVIKRDAKGVVKDANGMEILERKLYLAPHFPADAPTFRFAAKTSAPKGGGMPLVIDASMHTYFKELDRATVKVAEAFKKEEATHE